MRRAVSVGYRSVKALGLLGLLCFSELALAQSAPTITSFTPASGPVGTVITVIGTNLSAATTTAWVGAAHDALLTNLSSTSVTVTVPADAATGADQLAVFTAGGTAFSGSDFTVTSGAAAPTITSFTPTSGPAGTVITITGTNLSAATTTAWLGAAHDAPLTNVSGTSVTVTVPSDAATGADQLAVFTSGGTAFSGSDFTVTAAATPSITSFTPTSGPVGTVITVTGTNLTSATQGWVGTAHDATATNVNSTTVKITVPSDAATGADQLGLVYSSGTVLSATNFTVTAAAAPTISSFTPATGPVGTVITVTGTNLSGATTTAWIGSAHDASLTNVSSTSVTITVPSDAPLAADQLAIFAPGGTVFSGTNFTVSASGQGPTAPSGLTATATSSAQINLSWTASTDPVGVTGYLIQRCQGASCSTFAQIASVAGTVTTYSNTGLTASTNYTYQVQATDAAGNLSSFSSTASSTTQAAADTTPPTAPGTPSLTVASATQINLSWAASTDNVGVTGYLIQRCQGASCSTFAQIATVSGTVTTYGNSGLTASTSYSYRVQATDAAGNLSSFSGTAAAATQSGADTTPPTAPTGLTATAVATSQINLGWTASTDNVGVTAYLIERCTGASCSSFSQIASVTTGTSYGDTSVAATTSYSYRIRATDAAGNLGPYSSVVTRATVTEVAGPVTFTYDDLGRLTTVAFNNGSKTTYSLDAAGNRKSVTTTLDTSTLAAPSGLAGFALSVTSIQLTWTASADTSGSEVAGYNVYRAGTQIGTATTNSYTDSSVVGSTSYLYSVAGFDNAGNVSNQSTAVTVWSTDITAPSVPTGLGVPPGATSTSLTLTWTASTDTGGSGMAGYKIYRGGTQIGTSGTTSYLDSTVAGTTNYRYTVAAYDNAGNVSAQSTAFSYTTPDTIAPSVPTELTAVAPASGTVNLTWTAATDTGGSGLAGYQIYRGGTLIGTSTTASYSDTTTLGTTNYSYRVAAYDNAGNVSGQSTAFSVTTPDTIPPSVPTQFTATVKSASEIDMSWNASTDTGGSGLAGYNVYINSTLSMRVTNGTSWNDLSVGGNTTYVLTVAAYDVAGNVSAQTGGITLTTPSTVPSTPGKPSPSGKILSNTWTESWAASTGPVSYYILTRTNGTNTSTYTVTAPSVSAAQTGGNGVTYSLSVQACNSSNVCSGNGPISTVSICENGICP